MMKKVITLLSLIFFLSTTMTLAFQTYEYSLEVNIQSSVYQPGDQVKVFGNVKQNNNPISDKEIALQINTPLGIFHVNQIRTDQNGHFEEIITLKEESLQGYYTVYVTCENIISEKSFKVEENTKTLSLNLNMQEFSSGDFFAVAGTFYNKEPLSYEPIAVQVVNPFFAPIFLDQVETDSNGNYITGFKFPQNAVPGQYKIFVAGQGISNTDYFEVS